MPSVDGLSGYKPRDFKLICRFRLILAVLMLDIVMEWTLNALSTISSSYRKCSKPRTLGHSAQAISLLRIEGTTKCWRIARGFSFGNGMGSAAEQNPPVRQPDAGGGSKSP